MVKYTETTATVIQVTASTLTTQHDVSPSEYYDNYDYSESDKLLS